MNGKFVVAVLLGLLFTCVAFFIIIEWPGRNFLLKASVHKKSRSQEQDYLGFVLDTEGL